jgi:hypothetical protein
MKFTALFLIVVFYGTPALFVSFVWALSVWQELVSIFLGAWRLLRR